jgi:hypothetical protein
MHCEDVANSFATRQGDWGTEFHVRPLVIGLPAGRTAIAPSEAQLLLGALAVLPASRYPAARPLAKSIGNSLGRGFAIQLDESEVGTLQRAVAGVQARRPLPPGLARLRDSLRLD